MFNSTVLETKLSSITDYHKFLIAFSGGMDSTVLLHAMQCISRRAGTGARPYGSHRKDHLVIRAAHIHHGLSNNADSWVKHCKQICGKLDVELIVKYIEIKNNNKHSPEAIARELRYQKLAQLLQPDECLVVAHHADDQTETLLLQLFRGTGVAGLAAMPEQRPFGNSFLLRPLLNFSRSKLQQYAINNNLIWIEDESNENTGLDRNYIRHKLLPTIKQRWPSILQTTNRVTENCAAAQELLTKLASEQISRGLGKNTLAISELKQLTINEQNNIIRYWLKQLNLPTPSSTKLAQIQHDVLQCRQDANPCVHWSGAEIRRYRDNLYAMTPLPPHDSTITFIWDGKSELELPNQLGTITPEMIAKLDLKPPFKICFRHNGKPPHLKKKFQQLGIPPWLRDRIPLLWPEATTSQVDPFILTLSL